MISIKHFFLSAMIVSLFASCSAQKNSLIERVDALGKDQTIEDSIIRRLRNDHDFVIAYAVENFAWVRSINYLILAKTGDEWIGYHYYVNLMRNQPHPAAPGNINPAVVNKASCDSLLQYITEKEAWTIQGDTGQNFCPGANKDCNINDAAGARLWLITKKSVVNPSYYAPEFFEECCPGNKERALFMSIVKKIENIVSVQGTSR